jgi:hypothetical protein
MLIPVEALRNYIDALPDARTHKTGEIVYSHDGFMDDTAVDKAIYTANALHNFVPIRFLRNQEGDSWLLVINQDKGEQSV